VRRSLACWEKRAIWLHLLTLTYQTHMDNILIIWGLFELYVLLLYLFKKYVCEEVAVWHQWHPHTILEALKDPILIALTTSSLLTSRAYLVLRGQWKLVFFSPVVTIQWINYCRGPWSVLCPLSVFWQNGVQFQILTSLHFWLVHGKSFAFHICASFSHWHDGLYHWYWAA
jgi:hypothetical protein